MNELLKEIIIPLIVLIIGGLILLVIQYHTKWFENRGKIKPGNGDKSLPSQEPATVREQAEVQSLKNDSSPNEAKINSLVGSKELHAWSNTSNTSPHTVSYSFKTKRRIWQIIVALSTVITIFVFVTGIPDVPKLINVVRGYFAHDDAFAVPPLIMRLARIKDASLLRQALMSPEVADSALVGYLDQYENIDNCYIFVVDAKSVLEVYKFHDSLYYDIERKELVEVPLAGLFQKQGIVVCLRDEVYNSVKGER